MLNRIWKAIQDYKDMEHDDSTQEEVDRAYHELELMQEEFNQYEKEIIAINNMSGGDPEDSSGDCPLCHD